VVGQPDDLVAFVEGDASLVRFRRPDGRDERPATPAPADLLRGLDIYREGVFDFTALLLVWVEWRLGILVEAWA
jgi:hypothetical protein